MREQIPEPKRPATGQREGQSGGTGGGGTKWQSPYLKPAAIRGTSEGSLLGGPASSVTRFLLPLGSAKLHLSL